MTWIDFKGVKKAATFAPVLRHYQITTTGKGAEQSAHCPFHEDKNPSLRLNTERGIWQCFGCGEKGSILDFVAKKEGCSIRRAAVLVSELCGITPPTKEAPQGAATPKGADDGHAAESPADETPQEVNRPLTFRLQLTHDHPYLQERGVDPALAEEFQVGLARRGMMKHRIAIALRTMPGELVGYLGRWPGEDWPEDEDKYKFPPGFKKTLLLYNLHRVVGEGHLVVVEGPWSVFRLHQMGVPSVALLGRSLSDEQEALLREAKVEKITLLLDGDGPGRDAAAEILPRLAQHFFVHVAALPDETQPDTVDEEVLHALLSVPGS